MSLSVCCLAGAPGPRVRALLEPFAAVADEIVVAADARVPEADLAEYAAVAGRLFRIEFDYLERHFSWLHAQCSGDWIFRIDTDEVATPELLAALPELLADADVRQHWFPRRWLYGGSGEWLDEPPWWPDYQLRLYRNDPFLRFAGTLHSSAVSQPPSHYVDVPLYHLDLIVNSYESREEKARFYDSLRPGMHAPGGGAMNERYYLPELAPSVELEPVPAEHEREIERVLSAAASADPASAPAPAVVSRDEMDRHLDSRPFDPEVHRAVIAPTERTIRMVPAEERVVHFRVTNEGSERWPWHNPEVPDPCQVRLSYRWLRPDLSTYEDEGLRTWLPRSLRSGASTVVPLMVRAPTEEGDYVLDVDLVHEQWFGANVRVPVPVEPREEAAPWEPPPHPAFPPLFADFLAFEAEVFGDPTPTAVYDPYLIRYGEYRFILGGLPLENGTRIVDVGCEANLLMLFLAVNGADVTGVDVNEDLTPLIEERRSVVERATGRRASFRFEVQDATALDFEEGSIDAVIATSSIEHMFSSEGHGDQLAVSGIARILRPGGVAAITVPMSGGGPFHECELGDERFRGPYRLYTPRTLKERFLFHEELEPVQIGYLAHTTADPRFEDPTFTHFWTGLPVEERLKWSWANPTLGSVFNPMVPNEESYRREASLNTALLFLRKRG